MYQCLNVFLIKLVMIRALLFIQYYFSNFKSKYSLDEYICIKKLETDLNLYILCSNDGDLKIYYADKYKNLNIFKYMIVSKHELSIKITLFFTNNLSFRDEYKFEFELNHERFAENIIYNIDRAINDIFRLEKLGFNTINNNYQKALRSSIEEDFIAYSLDDELQVLYDHPYFNKKTFDVYKYVTKLVPRCVLEFRLPLPIDLISTRLNFNVSYDFKSNNEFTRLSNELDDMMLHLNSNFDILNIPFRIYKHFDCNQVFKLVIHKNIYANN